MKIISHRGNISGPNPIRENTIDFIEEAISEGFDVEIDLRVEDNEYYLGHDNAQYFTSIEWLEKHNDVLWIHCKNRNALEKISNHSVNFNYFYHESDSYTLTSKGIGWVLVGELPYSNSIIVLPEKNDIYLKEPNYIKNSFGVCTDIPLFYKTFL